MAAEVVVVIVVVVVSTVRVALKQATLFANKFNQSVPFGTLVVVVVVVA